MVFSSLWLEKTILLEGKARQMDNDKFIFANTPTPTPLT